jgi:hypothetical protein
MQYQKPEPMPSYVDGAMPMTAVGIAYADSISGLCRRLLAIGVAA